MQCSNSLLQQVLKLEQKEDIKSLNHYNIKISYNDVLKSIKNRDKNDYNRKISPLKKKNKRFNLD